MRGARTPDSFPVQRMGDSSMFTAQAGETMNSNMMNALSQSLGQAFSTINVGESSPQDMIQFGLGVGMALIQSGAFQGLMNPSNTNPSTVSHVRREEVIEDSIFPILSEKEYTEALAAKGGREPKMRRPNYTSTAPQVHFDEPIGVPRATVASNSVLNGLDHQEEAGQIAQAQGLLGHKLSALELAGHQAVRTVRDSDMPDFQQPLSRNYAGNR